MKLNIITYCFLLISISINSKSNAEFLNYLCITGSSNINNFKFINYNCFSEKDIIITELGIQKELKFKVKDFVSDNILMYSDFFDLLKADKYPEISIQIIDTSEVIIIVAGNIKRINLNCNIIKLSDNQILIKGSKKLLLSDFKLKAPSKLFNSIKVNEEIIIDFSFNVNLHSNKY